MIESIGCIIRGSNSLHQYSKQTYEGKYIYNANDREHIIIPNNVDLSPEFLESLVITGGYVKSFIWCNGFSFYVVECTPQNSPVIVENTELIIAKHVNPMSVIYYNEKCKYKIVEKLKRSEEEIYMTQYLEHWCINDC